MVILSASEGFHLLGLIKRAGLDHSIAFVRSLTFAVWDDTLLLAERPNDSVLENAFLYAECASRLSRVLR
jgi:hypothetical protein